MASPRHRNRTTTSAVTRLGVPAGIAALALLLLVPAGVAAVGGAKPAKKISYPARYTLTDSKIGHWSVVLKSVYAHTQPRASSPVVTKLSLVTSDGTQNVVLILAGQDVNAKQTWYKVRLPILPNNSTGWVSADAVGELTTVHTHLYVNLEKLTATLMLDGRPIFKSIVGVGKIR